ncbi:YeeE/YedE family protein [Ponticoccus alexandrii]|uniref:YeeE/YedE family protein n=1 Tax=Ponticoccus alexandrii TaxID=1943633 RepID=A0ABX7FCG3_9RHOB|nr:YeeE/YedE family protein [Ponticoccus alexandrii]ETA52671.1 YeeE/YedE family protein [Rhodobacteraceae bacterium PD-2]QRF67062.1 YeeE/YedE family protein [Ponticoccus alexandrii]
MFESLGFETLTAPQVSVFFALIVGALFGVLAERTKFCFRRSLVGEDHRQAMGVWLTALVVAILGTQGAVALGLIDFSDHRFMASGLPVVAIVAGGLMFGAGMVLTRGCISRLTVLSATGNLRAVTVLVVFAIAAHATLKGVLAPVRTTLGAWTLDLGETVSLANLPGGAAVWSALLALAALAYALRSGNRPLPLIGAALLGALVPLAWVGTGYILYDDFDPIALQSLSFTSPWADTLFWTIASSSIPAGFGVGLVGGVLAGSLLSALAARRFTWQSFTAPRETGRYLTGAVLMGVGGVLAGGCTVGAGLAGIPTLSFAALLALAAIATGGLAMNAALTRSPRGAALQPAE